MNFRIALTIFVCMVLNLSAENECTSRSGAWRPIQEQVRDTVVQIFSQIAEYNWLEPYATPRQYAVRGSGFFIDDIGHIVTNAHVVHQAIALWIQVPSFGKRLFKVSIIGICPERDLALLKLTQEDVQYVQQMLGGIPYLMLGDSDTVMRADETLALGYPLGQESLKSTAGLVSGRERHLIQISAPINPGNSGGPLLNSSGEVIGINCSGILEAQNVGYSIPVNDLKKILPHLKTTTILRRPILGLLTIKGSEYLTAYLQNPEPGGCYVVDVLPQSPLQNAGVQSGDMIYQLNGYRVDLYGDITLPWSEDKVSINDYIASLNNGEDITLVYYRHGQEYSCNITINHSSSNLPIREWYPWHEQVDYEVFAGMVIMPLTINHIKIFSDRVAGLKLYTLPANNEPVLVISHIFPSTEIARTRSIAPGFTIKEVNGMKVRSLQEFRDAVLLGKESGTLLLTVQDEITRITDKVPCVLPFDVVLKETIALSSLFKYPLSNLVTTLMQEVV